MDDIENELNAAASTSGINTGYDSDENGQSNVKFTPFPLSSSEVYADKKKETGFHKTIRQCLGSIRDAMLNHRWEDAAKYVIHYTNVLEDSKCSLSTPEMIWRLGCEILLHHPNAKPDDIIDLYEQMKNHGVTNFSKITLDHAFHLLVTGQPEEARRQLSAAESWRYGQQTAPQSQELSFIRAYRGFLDYVTWGNIKCALDEEDHHDDGSNPEMHNFFRQASVTLQEVIRKPGVWDPFVLGYVEMLEFYNDHKGAENILRDYAYDPAFPLNPNAHVYLYEFLKRTGAPKTKQMKVLEILQTLVPSHKLVLEYCNFLLSLDDNKNLRKALEVIMDLLEYASWRQNMDAWKCLKGVLVRMRGARSLRRAIKEEWQSRKDLWVALHFSTHHARKDAQVDMELMSLKAKVYQCFFVRSSTYHSAVYLIHSASEDD